jgi:hypothetical protein
LPRRHLICAAGALAAAAVLAVTGQADAQTYGSAPLRGSITPEQGSDGTYSATVRKATEAGVGTQDDGSSADADTDAATDQPSTPSNQAGPLGGLGDAPQVPEADTEPVLAVEAEEGLTPLPGIDLTRREIGPLHSATLPERHDLDPYLPIGMRFGTFLFFPEVETGGIFTDNVLGTRTDAHSDQAIEVSPTLRLVSDWSRHFFAAEFNADRSWYEDFPVEDDKNYQGLLKGRIDVTRRTHLGLEAEKSQTQEGRNSISLTDIAGEQTILQEQHLEAYADHNFNRVTMKLTGIVADYDYNDDQDPFLEGPVPFQDIRDYRQTQGTLRTSYEFTPRWTGFVEGSLNERDYKQEVSSEGIRRGSTGSVVAAGATVNFSNKLTGEISLGWGQQESIEQSFSPIEGPLLNADLIWLPTSLTKVEFIARSEIDETTLVDSFGAIDRFYELSVQHAFWTYLVLGAYLSYEKADYVDSSLVDQRIKEGLTGEYYFNPLVSTYARYEHTDFFSTDEESDFVENEVRVGMRFRR